MARKTYRKVITSPELIAEINPKNKKLIDRFIKNFDTKRSDKSVLVYKSNFNIFFCWNVMENENKFFVDIRKSEMMDFFDFAVSELQWSPNRYAQMWSSLSSLSNFIENILDDDYPNFRNQVKKIEKLPKNTVRKKTVLSEEQVNNLMEYLISDDRKQEACFLALAISSGARVSELFRFTTDLIDEENTAFDGLFLETTEEIKTKGFGKQGKMLYKYIIKDTFLPKYKDWLLERAEILEKTGQEHNFLFIKPNGEPADISNADAWTEKWEKYLTNLEPSNEKHEEIHVYPHCLRHYWCTYLSKLGVEMELIVELQGWSTPEMAFLYSDITAKDKKWKGLNKLKDALEQN